MKLSVGKISIAVSCLNGGSVDGTFRSTDYDKVQDKYGNKLKQVVLTMPDAVEMANKEVTVGSWKTVNDRILKAFGSQGQQRSAALALKLAQLEYVRQEIDEFPVLLLDDVMSELDDQRRCQLLQFIDGKVQTFITVNDKALIPDLSGNAYFRIIEGRIAEG